MSKKSVVLVVLMVLLMALFAFPAFAQAATIEGTVTAGGVAVSNASVSVFKWYGDGWGYETNTSTGLDGTWPDFTVPAGTYFVWSANETRSADAASSVFEVAEDGTQAVALALTKETGLPGSYFALIPDEVAIARAVLKEESYFTLPDGSSSDRYSDEDVKFRIRAHDVGSPFHGLNDLAGSGIAAIHYSVNRGPAVVATDTTSVLGTATVDGVNAIEYWAVDNVGNVGKTRTRLIYIDKTAPMTSYDMAAATGQTIMLVGTDSGSGVGGTFWRIGGTGEFKPGNLVSVPATGVSTLEFYSVDKAGNYEAVKSMTIQAKAILTTPKASTSGPRAGRTFYMRGAVTGRPLATGTLRVYKLVSGKYRYVSKKSFKASSTGAYRVAFKLKRGTYRFKAYCGANTVASSNPPATSGYSARSTVR